MERMHRMGRCRELLATTLVGAVLIAQAFDVSAAEPLPIIPGAAGFGMETPAGSGRHLSVPKTRVIRVTNLNPKGPGSLRAALEAEDGAVFVGANIENASFGVTNCAERVALGAAVTSGARAFRRLVIVTQSEPPAAPCGACRQALAEFGLDLAIESIGAETTKSWTLGELLPSAFRAGDMRK